MEEKFASKVQKEKYDLSDYRVSTHAICRYSTKCFPSLSLMESLEKLKNNTKSLNKVVPTVAKKKKYKGSNYFIDNEDIIYVVENHTIITVFPNERIFKAKINKKHTYRS